MKGFTENDPRARLAGQKGGKASRQRSHLQAVQKWIDRGIDPQVVRQIRREGYISGYALGRTRRKAIA